MSPSILPRASLAALAIAVAACSPSSSTTDVRATGASTTTGAAGGTGQGGAAAQGGAGQGGAGHGGAGPGGGAGQGGQAAGHACKETSFGGERPVKLHVPPGYQCGTQAPLLFMLHGYASSGAIEELYFNFAKSADEKGFLYAHPEGTKDTQQSQFWNATDACCNFYGSTVDDSAYVLGLIDEIAAEYDVDPKRIYLFGHSNGAFMAYRMACDHADRIAAVGGLAGAMFQDVGKCAAKEPVSVLSIHGTADGTIAYLGGMMGVVPYPSAKQTVEDWATIDGCSMTPDASAAPKDLDSMLFGDETTVSTYGGCGGGSSVQLWSIFGGAHIPTLSPTFTPSVVDFLLAQHKP